MSYSLVCLVGDQPTRIAAEFAKWLHVVRPAESLKENPPVDDVRRSVAVSRALVVFGHNGPIEGVHSLRAEASGNVWMRGEDLGRAFAGARVYLWACDTMGSGSTRAPGISYLGDEARRAGVACVAGHSLKLSADFEQLGGLHAEVFRRALAELIWGFVDGEDDEQRLKLRARTEMQRLDFTIDIDAGALPPTALDWFRRVQWLEDRIAGFHVARDPGA